MTAPVMTLTSPAATSSPMLEVVALSVNYGGIRALQDVNLSVYPGEVVTLIGANGAGKTTLLRTVSRIVKPRTGQIRYEGRDLLRLRPDQVVKLGIAQCPEGRRVLARQSVIDNLYLGAYTRNDAPQILSDIERQFTFFPRLGE